MKWERGHKSDNVEDRRGGKGGKAVKLGGGIGGILMLIVGAVVFGPEFLVQNPELVKKTISGVGSKGGAKAPGEKGEDPEKEQVEFISFVLDDIQAHWMKAFKAKGQRYKEAKLVIFTDSVDSACGHTSAAVGPFYCPADTKAYIDLGFYKQLKSRFGAPGDFAQAYVLAHEIGHHVQNLQGTSRKIHIAQKQNPDKANKLSVLLELQADCLAGVWAHSTKQRKLLDAGDLEEGLRAASAIGDDTLQKNAGRRVQPESWTHGSSSQRVKWFRKGYKSGDMDICDTFEAGP